MRGLTRSALGLAAGLAVALSLASCGGGGADLLAGETAEEITENLELVQELADAGDCVGAEEATAEVLQQVEELDVDARLQEALSKGIDRLSEAVSRCQEAGEEEPAETTDTTAEPEAEEERGKPGREKKRDEEPEQEEEREAPPQNEEGEGEETQPEEAESESGGVSPATPAEGE